MRTTTATKPHTYPLAAQLPDLLCSSQSKRRALSKANLYGKLWLLLMSTPATGRFSSLVRMTQGAAGVRRSTEQCSPTKYTNTETKLLWHHQKPQKKRWCRSLLGVNVKTLHHRRLACT